VQPYTVTHYRKIEPINMCERYKNHQYRKLCYESSDAINESLCAAAINQQIKLNKGGGNTYIKPNVKRK